MIRVSVRVRVMVRVRVRVIFLPDLSRYNLIHVDLFEKNQTKALIA